MPNLENLTSKIIRDAENIAKNVLEEAKRKEEKIINDEIKKGEVKKEEIIKKAYEQCESKKHRIISSAHLFVRNKKLEAKQHMIDIVYKEALEKLQSLSKEDYLFFIRNSLLTLNIDGDEEIILSEVEKYIGNKFIDSINDELKVKGKKGEIKISFKRGNFKGGFILAKNGIEINNTFEALVFSLKNELEPVIIETLFG